MTSILRPARLAGLAVAAAVCLGSFAFTDPVPAQLKDGEFAMYQPGSEGPVGWAYCTADRSHEYWVYIEGTYDWADVDNGPSNPWRLKGIRTGDGNWASYSAFVDHVRSLPAAQGKVLTCEDHSIVRVTLEN